MSNNHASYSSPILDSPSKVAGLIFLNSPSRWSTCFLFMFVFVLSSAKGIPLDELCPFSISCPKFLKSLLLTYLSLLSSFGIFLVTILHKRTSFISCWAFFCFSLLALKTYSSTMRLLIVSKTSVGDLVSLFCLWFSGSLCSGFPSIMISMSSCAAMINTKHKRFYVCNNKCLLVFHK